MLRGDDYLTTIVSGDFYVIVLSHQYRSMRLDGCETCARPGQHSGSITFLSQLLNRYMTALDIENVLVTA